MKTEIKEYNMRQIKLMGKKIKDYLNKKIYIDWLINDLEGLVNCIKNPPKGFVNNFLHFWSRLEVCYANMLFEKRNYFTSQEKDLIQEALINIQELIEKYKTEYLSDLEE